MGRGRPKKKDKLTRAEISRNYRQKKKLKDPDGVKKSVATSNKKQYEKNKHNLNYIMKKRKDSVLKYYNKKAKTVPQLQVISASKEKGSSWGVGIAYNGIINTIKIFHLLYIYNSIVLTFINCFKYFFQSKLEIFILKFLMQLHVYPKRKQML